MADKPCLLLACRKVAYEALSPILRDCFRIIHTATLSETLQTLKRETGIDVVLATVSFDDHRMFDLLREVKARHPELPFVACRAHDTELNQISLEGVRIASQALGAAAFIDLTALAERYGDARVAEKACGLILTHLPPSMRR
jgi:DNA-binding NarL/FixJ family response regulator